MRRICYTIIGMTIIVIILMIALNAVFAAYEMALASIARTKLSVLAQEKRSGAQAALFMKDHLEGSLAVVQIGITLIGTIAAAAGGAQADDYFVPFFEKYFGLYGKVAYVFSMAAVVLPLSFITIVFAELAPKTFALQNKDLVVLRISPVMRILYVLLLPIVAVMEHIVRFLTRKTKKSFKDDTAAQKAALADLRTAASIASASRLFGKTEEKIVLASAQFCVRKIKEIQVPLEQVYTLNANDSIAETFLKAHLDMHTRFPVRENPKDPQSIIGYLNFKDIFASTKSSSGSATSTRAIMRPILRLDEDTIISAALQKMMKSKQHICLVTDENEITGILTLEDIFEEMVGEIEDEYDFFPAYIRPFGNSLVASATARMTDIFEKLDVAIPAGLSADISVEQWLEQKLGRTPAKNEKICACGIILETRKFRRHKLMEALVTRAK